MATQTLTRKRGLNKEITSRIRHAIIWITITSFVSLSITYGVYFVEKDVNTGMRSLEDMLWWWIVTISGIGGGVMPETVTGKVLSSLVIILSLVLFAIVISEVASLIRLTSERKELGIIRVSYRDHIVIYGYSSLTAGVIKLLRSYFGPDLKIVLISNDVKHNPFPNEVDFIYANPIDRNTFVEANAQKSIASIILANDRFTDPDAYSLVIATGVEMYNPQSVTIVEVMDDAYKDLYKIGNIEAFINRKDLLSDLLNKNHDSKLVRIIQKETPLSPNVEEPKADDVELL